MDSSTINSILKIKKTSRGHLAPSPRSDRSVSIDLGYDSKSQRKKSTSKLGSKQLWRIIIILVINISFNFTRHFLHNLPVKWWKFRKHLGRLSKGQSNWEWIYDVIISPKMQTKNYKDFCPTIQRRIVALFFLVNVGSFFGYNPCLFGRA